MYKHQKKKKLLNFQINILKFSFDLKLFIK
jgi:hypothetical protein